MIRALYRPPGGTFRTDLAPTGFAAALKERDGLLWVDLGSEPPETCEPLLRETFGFHELSVTDALQEAHLPKVDDWGTYLYAVLHSVALGPDGLQVKRVEVDVFLGPNFLVTHHPDPVAALDRVWANAQRDARLQQAGADHLLYAFADELAEGYFPVVDALDEEADRLQDQVLRRATAATLHRILELRRQVSRLQRITGPQREALSRLARDEYAVVDVRTRVYFRDVHDQFVQLHDRYESLRDLVTSSVETYLSAVSNRLNEVMKRLTIIATFFMPASFIVSFFGMNRPLDVFGYLVAKPGTLDTPLAAAVAVAILIVLVVSFIATYWVMRRRGWM